MDNFMEKVYERLKNAVIEHQDKVEKELEKLVLDYSEKARGEINMSSLSYTDDEIEKFVQHHKGLIYSGKFLSWSKWFWDKFDAEKETSNVEKS